MNTANKKIVEKILLPILVLVEQLLVRVNEILEEINNGESVDHSGKIVILINRNRNTVAEVKSTQAILKELLEEKGIQWRNIKT